MAGRSLPCVKFGGGAVRDYVDFVAVYFANQDLKGNPEFYVPREDAREQVNTFMASWKKNARAIQMNYALGIHRADLSLTMGPDVIEGYAANKPHCIGLVEGWRAA